MPKSDLRIDILGTSFSITADEDSAYLESLLNHYRIKVENTRKKTGLSDPLKLAVVTGFLLCDEAQKAQNGGAPADPEISDLDEAERLTLDLITRIDEVLENGNKLRIFRQDDSLKHLVKLENTVKHYDWGSPRWIPQLLGRENVTAEPWAELWMGVHPEGPSLVTLGGDQENQDFLGTTVPEESKVSLEELIRRDPEFYLGEQIQKEFGGLPFLYKLLAAGKPLSVQAHPDLKQAGDGWERENNAGISLKAPNRNYKDAKAKPEILCALSPFRAMCGFREPGEIKRLLDIFSGAVSGGAPPSVGVEGTQNNGDAVQADTPVSEALAAGFARLRTALEGDGGTGDRLRDFLTALLSLDKEARLDLGDYTIARGPELERLYPGYADEWRTAAYCAGLYPGDPAVIAPLYLNLLRLTPGEAVYLPAGVLHAYIEGFGVELMANSDNVLRGGLTSKHVDIEELTRILKFDPYRPEILRPVETGDESADREPIWSYPTDCREFSLGVTQSRGEDISFPAGGPEILLVTQGKARLSWGKEEVTLEPGESAFAAQRKHAGDLVCSGSFTIFAASVGSLV
ncbi:hypothetical protein FACS1894130_08590 [Spirochaetia bacterium]|nr:hypothetical protein FACS1894130_08590 [Spirochaetia bacterium]